MLTEAARPIIDALAGAGVTAVTDPRDLRIPGAIVSPTSWGMETLAASTVTWEVWLIAPAGDPLGGLSTLLEAACFALDVTAVTFESLTIVNHSPDPLPAIHFQAQTNIKET